MSFSNVKYDEIAAYVWLDPSAEGSDIRPLETFRSRIPKNIFRNICIDVDKAMVQYGRMESHETEEARSRFIASVSSSCTVSHSVDSDREKKMQLFSEIVFLFGNIVVNKPEGLLDSEFTKRGRIEHLFYAVNSVSIVFIEVKKTLFVGKGKLDIIAQVLAECAGMFKFRFIIAQLQISHGVYSLRLYKLEGPALGANSCHSLRWREVRILGLRLWHQIRLLLWNRHRSIRQGRQASNLCVIDKRK